MGLFKTKDGKKTKIGKVIKGALRVVDNAVLGGVVTNLTSDIEGVPEGKLDWKRLLRIVLSSTVPVVLLTLLAKGVITMDELKDLFNTLTGN